MKFTSKVGDVKILKLKSQSKSYKFSQKSCGSFQSSLEPIVYLSWLMYYLFETPIPFQYYKYISHHNNLYFNKLKTEDQTDSFVYISHLKSGGNNTTGETTSLLLFLLLDNKHSAILWNSSASWKIDWGLQCKISVCCGFVNFVLVC